MNSVIKDIDQDEASSAASYSRLAQDPAFTQIRFKVSKYTVILLEREWAALSEQITAGEDVISPPNSCKCELLLRFGIAYRHYLKKAYIDNLPIPKTLFHLR